MSDLLIQSLKAQARLHHKSSAHGLGKMFDCAVDEIESLRTQLATAKEKNYTLTKTYNNLFDSYQYLEDEMIEIKGQQAKDQGE